MGDDCRDGYRHSAIQTGVRKTKVVDDVNNPKVVYHGSPNAFDEFSYKFKGAQGQTEGYGFYFTDDISIAEGYAKGTTTSISPTSISKAAEQ